MKRTVFSLNQDRRLEPVSPAVFPTACQDGQSHYWIDIESPDASALAEFLSPLQLHPLILESILDPAATSRVAPYTGALFIKLPTQLAENTLTPVVLSLICLPQILLSIHESSLLALDSIAAEFSTAVRFHTLSTAAILYQILDRVIDDDMALALATRRKIDALEEALDQDADSVQIDQILTLKRRVARLAATCEDQYYCMTTLETVESEVFDVAAFHEYFRDSAMHLEYALRSMGRQHAHLSELHQHYLLTLQEKTNQRLKLLTILSAVFLPLMLVAGLYGMNFRYMPELEWIYGYPFVLAAMCALAGILLWTFYRKGWFN